MQQWRQELFFTKRYGRGGLPTTIHLTRPVLQAHQASRGTTTFTGIGYCTRMYHPTELANPALYHRSPRLIPAEDVHGFLNSSIFAMCNVIYSCPRSNHI